MLRGLASGSCAALLACGEPPIVAPEPSKVVPEQAAPVVAAAAAPAPAPASASTTPSGLVLHPIAHRDGPLRLLRLGDGEVVVVAAPAFARVGADGALVRDPTWSRGLAGVDTDAADLRSLTFAGAAPRWLVSEARPNRTYDAHGVFRWQDGRWQSQANSLGDISWYYDGATAWRGGALALRAYALNTSVTVYESGTGNEMLELEERSHARALARHPTRFVALDTDARPPRLPARFVARSFVAAPTGEVYTYGMHDRRDSVARWPAGGSAVIDVLPGIPEAAVTDIQLALGATPGTLYAFGEVTTLDPDDERKRTHGPYLARFADGQWTLSTAAIGRPVCSLSEAPDGALWAVHSDACGIYDGSLWRRAGDGAWTAVALADVRFADDARDRLVSTDNGDWRRLIGDAEAAARAWPVSVDQVVTRGEELWIVARLEGPGDDDTVRDGRYAVLRSSPAPRVLGFPPPRRLAAELSEWTEPTPWHPGQDMSPPRPRWGRYEPPDYRACSTVFVALAEPTLAEEARLSELVPPLADSRGLAVHLVEASLRDRQQLGALIDVPAREEAVTELVDDLVRASPGLQPLLRCHVPWVTRFFGPRPDDRRLLRSGDDDAR